MVCDDLVMTSQKSWRGSVKTTNIEVQLCYLQSHTTNMSLVSLKSSQRVLSRTWVLRAPCLRQTRQASSNPKSASSPTDTKNVSCTLSNQLSIFNISDQSRIRSNPHQNLSLSSPRSVRLWLSWTRSFARKWLAMLVMAVMLVLNMKTVSLSP